jgi:hypothetical protein
VSYSRHDRAYPLPSGAVARDLALRDPATGDGVLGERAGARSVRVQRSRLKCAPETHDRGVFREHQVGRNHGLWTADREAAAQGDSHLAYGSRPSAPAQGPCTAVTFTGSLARVGPGTRRASPLVDAPWSLSGLWQTTGDPPAVQVKELCSYTVTVSGHLAAVVTVSRR